MGVRPLRIRWSEPAETRLDQLLGWIATENPEVARKLWRRVMDALERAARHPESAPRIQDLGPDYREVLSVRPFRQVYRIEGKTILVITALRQEHDFDPGRFLE